MENIICDDCELEDEDAECEACRQKNTKKTKAFKPIAYALKLSSEYPDYDLPVESYFGEDCVEHFIARLVMHFLFYCCLNFPRCYR